MCIKGMSWSEFLREATCAEKMNCGKWWEQGQPVHCYPLKTLITPFTLVLKAHYMHPTLTLSLSSFDTELIWSPYYQKC